MPRRSRIDNNLQEELDFMAKRGFNTQLLQEYTPDMFQFIPHNMQTSNDNYSELIIDESFLRNNITPSINNIQHQEIDYTLIDSISEIYNQMVFRNLGNDQDEFILDFYNEMMNPQPLQQEKIEETIHNEQNYIPGYPKDQIDTIFDSSSIDITCTICQEAFRNPLIIACGHIFCELCIKRSLKNKKICPNCNGPAYENDLRIVPMLKSYISGLQIKCYNEECKWKNKIELYDSHELSCSHK
jgi:hypothetical protein